MKESHLEGKRAAGARAVPVLVLLLAAVLLAVVGCGSQGVEAEGETVWTAYSAETVALYPVAVNGAMGYIDRTGSLVIPAQFAEAQWFSEGLAAVRLGPYGPWGYIDKNGAMIIEAQFSSASPFSQGRAAVQPDFDGPWGLIDTTGTLLIQPQFAAAWPYSEDLARVRAGGEAGYIDSTGKWIITTTDYLPVDEFSQGLAAVYEYETNKYGFIDKGGSLVLAPTYEEAWGFSEDLAAVRLPADASGPGLWGYIDRHGDWFIEARYANARSFSEGLAAVQLEPNGDWGYIDVTGSLAIGPVWDEAGEFYEGLAQVGLIVREDQYTGPVYAYAYIDMTGNVIWQEAALSAPSGSPSTTVPTTSSTVAP